jgi:hypothetical protein
VWIEVRTDHLASQELLWRFLFRFQGYDASADPKITMFMIVPMIFAENRTSQMPANVNYDIELLPQKFRNRKMWSADGKCNCRNHANGNAHMSGV